MIIGPQKTNTKSEAVAEKGQRQRASGGDCGQVIGGDRQRRLRECVGVYSGENFLVGCLKVFSATSAARPELFLDFLDNPWVTHVKVCSINIIHCAMLHAERCRDTRTRSHKIT